MNLEHGLTEQQAAPVVGAHGQREEGVDARRGLKDGLAETPAAEIGRVLARAADVAPEIEEVVARSLRHLELRVLALRGVALQAARAEVLDDEEGQRLREAGQHVGAEPRLARAQVLRKAREPAVASGAGEIGAGGRKVDAQPQRLARAPRVEGILDRFADQRVGEAAERFGREELRLGRVDVHLAGMHAAEMPVRIRGHLFLLLGPGRSLNGGRAGCE